MWSNFVDVILSMFQGLSRDRDHSVFLCSSKFIIVKTGSGFKLTSAASIIRNIAAKLILVMNKPALENEDDDLFYLSLEGRIST